MGNENNDCQKVFARIQKIFTYIISNEVTRPFGDLYAGVQLPLYCPQGTSVDARTSQAPQT
jgi:hypothetical protein